MYLNQLGCRMLDQEKHQRRRASSREEKIYRKSNNGLDSSRREKRIGLSVLKPGEAEKIHEAVKKILWDVGIIIEHEKTLNSLVIDHKCRQEENGYIKIPPELVDEAISTIPNKIQLFDLDGNLRVDTNSNTKSYCPGANSVRILDHRTGELRPCLLDDIRETARLCDQLPNIDVTSTLGYPSDIPAEDEAFEATRIMFENCKKPAIILAHDEHIQERIISYAANLLGGMSKIADKPIVLELMGPISPLKLPSELCERLINSARWKIPCVCYPASFPGMSCPISIAGAIAQSSAEAIAGIIVHQLAEPGSPIMSGSAILTMDMRQADLAYGSPEYMLSNLGAAEYFSSIGIPCWIGAGCSDSHDFDAQAASEAGSNLTVGALASSSFVHNLGFLSGGRTGSLEMLALCDEIIGWSSRIANSFNINTDELAIDVIKNSVYDNSYLTSPHTQERFLTENWFPSLSERSDAEAWIERGSLDMRARVKQRIFDLLGN